MKLTPEQIKRIRALDRTLFAGDTFPSDWLEQLCDLALDRQALLEEAIRLCEQQIRSDEARGRLQARSILTRTITSLRALAGAAT